MRATSFSVLTAILSILGHCAAQVTLNASACVKGSGVTAFPDCDYMQDTITSCAGPGVASGAPFIACMCNQELFNSYFGCESEERLCVGNSDPDPSIQTGIDQWHSICDGRISFTPTTPPISSVTAPYDDKYCLTAESACASVADANSACSISYAGKSQSKIYSSCLCQPSILSLEYTCAFLGNISCQQTSAALSNLPDYRFCSNLVSVLGGNNGTGPASSPATTTMPTTNNVTSTTSLESTSESTPTITSASTPTITSASTPSITQPTLPGPSTSIPSVAATKSSAALLARLPSFTVCAAHWGSLVLALMMIT